MRVLSLLPLSYVGTRERSGHCDGRSPGEGGLAASCSFCLRFLRFHVERGETEGLGWIYDPKSLGCVVARKNSLRYKELAKNWCPEGPNKLLLAFPPGLGYIICPIGHM
mgnify:CR=1 FL=1